MHGEAWQSSEPVAEADSVRLETWLEFGPGASVFEAFPFAHRLGLTVTLQSSPEFSHLVLYSPRGEGFFCLENQTCSTDAHNLYDRGFRGESGLKTVGPGERRQGSVTYAVSFHTHGSAQSKPGRGPDFQQSRIRRMPC